MFIFNYLTLYIIPFLVLSLYYLSQAECNKKNCFYYICKNYNPTRNLYIEEEVIELLRYNIKRYEEKTVSDVEFFTFLETCTAEYIVILLQEIVRSKDPFIKVKLEVKILRIFRLYDQIYEKDIFNSSLIQKIIIVIQESYIDLYNTILKLETVLKYDQYLLDIFYIYCKNQERFVLNDEITEIKEDLVINLFNLIKDSSILEYNE